MDLKISDSFNNLRKYCEFEEFKGWDPYDGLNSKIFQSIPFISKSPLARLIWIQLFKRNPVNLRKIFLIDKGYNPKGLGLFLSGYCLLYKSSPSPQILDKINSLAGQLLKLRTDGYSGSCWGYNFDWQAKAFFQPKYTPTVVASTYIGYALFDAFDITNNPKYKEAAISICDFIIKDLNRTYDDDGDFAFSYSPEDKTQVFNASLLGSRMLSRTFYYTHDIKYIELAKKSVSFCCKHQKKDGSWSYGTLNFHQWIDNFHTGFNLECIHEYQKFSNDKSFENNLNIGLDYYLNNFFTNEGIPKYYNNSIFPVDVHATAQLILTLYRMDLLVKKNDMAKKVLLWTIKNMQNSDYFYYQKHKYFSIKIPYMRWSQSWMFFSLIAYISSFSEQNLQ